MPSRAAACWVLLVAASEYAGAQSEGDARGGKMFPPAHLFAKQHVPPHSRFVWSEGDGTFELEVNRSLRLAMVGKGQKRWLELKATRPAVHEKFEFKNGALRLEANPTLCVGLRGGVAEAGSALVMQACENEGDGPVPHQGFLFALDGRVKSRSSGLCVNANTDRAELGSELVLGPCGDHYIFARINSKIAVKTRTDLHWNVKGGSQDGEIVLWKSPAAPEETFEFTEKGQLILKDKRSVCVRAQGGVLQGSQVMGWPCDKEEDLTAEQWGYDPRRFVIYSQANESLVFNLKGGFMKPGHHVVLWPAREPRPQRPGAAEL